MNCELILEPKIYQIIVDNLEIRKEERDLYGEVFTPIELVCDMLSQLPESSWKDSSLKWLDPSSGIGNFPILVYYKLMKSLQEQIPIEKERSKHIIENMIYMVELNSEHIKTCTYIFQLIHPGAIPNIIEHDFLTFEGFNLVTKFDIIMGNPPFQTRDNGRKLILWKHFVTKSIGIFLQENGYLLFVHPNGWRNSAGRYKKVFTEIQKRNLISLTMRSYKDGLKMFGGSATNYDYYCLQNKFTNTNKTKINDFDRITSLIDLNSFEFIPSGKFEIISKLVGNKEDKVNFIYSSHFYETRPHKSKYPISKTKDDNHKYPIIYSITKKLGPKLMYSNEKDSMMFVPKIIWSDGVGTQTILDNEGKYGLTQFAYAITDTIDNLKLIQDIMNHKKFIELNKYLPGQDHKYHSKIISLFKKDFYKYFLTS
jgi:hypothetical protein